MTPRNVINTFDVIIYSLTHVVNESNQYINEILENHYAKFPEDRGSALVVNVNKRAVSNQDVYISRLISNLQYMQRAFRDKTLNKDTFEQNVDVAKRSLIDILKNTLIGTDRSRYLKKAIEEYGNLQHFMNEYMKGNMEKIPIAYAEAGWRPISKGIWQKEQGIFVLTVQEYDGKFFSTVKDVQNRRIYSNPTPFNTPMEAMNASITSMAKIGHKTNNNKQEDYKPKYVNGQGRLF